MKIGTPFLVRAVSRSDASRPGSWRRPEVRGVRGQRLEEQERRSPLPVHLREDPLIKKPLIAFDLKSPLGEGWQHTPADGVCALERGKSIPPPVKASPSPVCLRRPVSLRDASSASRAKSGWKSKEPSLVLRPRSWTRPWGT